VPTRLFQQYVVDARGPIVTLTSSIGCATIKTTFMRTFTTIFANNLRRDNVDAATLGRWFILSSTYLGPPDLITSDARKQFTAREFKQLATNMGIKVKTVPVGSHHSIGMVERYHDPLRRVYSILESTPTGHCKWLSKH
jgi:transposase InsO family protein